MSRLVTFLKSLPIKRWLGYLAALIVISFVVNLWQTRDHYLGVLPAVTLQSVSGEAIIPGKSSTTEAQGLKLIYFFAEWCPICSAENSNIQWLSQYYPVTGFAMQSGDDEAVKSYLRNNDLSFPVVNDPQGKFARVFGVNGVPSLFIVDGQSGTVLTSTQGYTTVVGLLLRLWWYEVFGITEKS